MEKPDALEAEPIVQRLLNNLANAIARTDQAGVNAKVVIGWTSANALALLSYDQLGEPLDTCFENVRLAGATLPQMDTVRVWLDVETPQTLGATLIRDSAIRLCLAQEAKIIAAMTFVSRQDVDQVLSGIQIPFDKAEEVAADTNDPMDFRSIIQLRAAVVNHLVSYARPLPSMVSYWFADALPSLIISQRLYGDASRYDEIRAENKIVHPAFCPTQGQALSQ